MYYREHGRTFPTSVAALVLIEYLFSCRSSSGKVRPPRSTGIDHFSPEEVEDVLMMHPAIYDVVVISVDDLKRGQQFKAVVRVKPEVRECSDLAADIIDYARDRVAHEKAPQRVDFVNDIPRTRPESLIGVNSS